MDKKKSVPSRPPRLVTRLWRHLWLDHSDVVRLLGPGWDAQVTQEIGRLESRGSAEVRLCVEPALPWPWLLRSLGSQREPVVRERALELFGQLRIWDTEHNTGVLLYVLLADHAIEVVSDRGLRGIKPEQWQALTNELAQGLQQGQGQTALLRALKQCGALLDGLDLPGDHHGNELPDRPHTAPQAPMGSS